MALDIGKSLSSKISSNNKYSIESNEIKQLVAEELKNRNENTIAESYIGYSKNTLTELREEFSGSDKYVSKVQPTTETHQKQFVKNKDNTAGEEHKLGLS
jgi:hypothetical protein